MHISEDLAPCIMLWPYMKKRQRCSRDRHVIADGTKLKRTASRWPSVHNNFLKVGNWFQI
jgi:hypothetical protein